MRFLQAVYQAIREQVGPDYLVFIKLGMMDGVEGGLTADEGVQIVAALEAMGLTPEETAMVGDSLRADVEGAKAQGMTAVWRRPPLDEPVEAGKIVWMHLVVAGHNRSEIDIRVQAGQIAINQRLP